MFTCCIGINSLKVIKSLKSKKIRIFNLRAFNPPNLCNACQPNKSLLSSAVTASLHRSTERSLMSITAKVEQTFYCILNTIHLCHQK